MTKKINIPVIKNEEYILRIDTLGSSGEGIGKIKGFTVFVEKALPEELVKVKIIKIKKNYGVGKLIEIFEASKCRVEPICNIFGKCGGCQLQHLEYKEQLIYKKQKVIDSIERIGEIKSPKVENTLGMEEPYYYRNKVQYPVGLDNEKIAIGFYAQRSHRIVETDVCYLQNVENEKIVKAIKEYMLENNISPYNEEKHEGLVRHIVIRRAEKSGLFHITVVINGNILKSEPELIKKIKEIPLVSGLAYNINKEKSNVIMGEKLINIWGSEYLQDSIGSIKYKISPKSFYQVNPKQTKVLYEKVLEYAQLTGNETVWDAYCGIGTITLFLAQKAKKVYGVEILSEAIKDAKENAKLNNIENVEFFVGEAEKIIVEKYNKEKIKADVIVVDPPRKGCDEKLLDCILQMQPQKIIYVSCDPSTLARDIKKLTADYYKLDKVQPIDMFGHSYHVETVVKLIKK